MSVCWLVGSHLKFLSSWRHSSWHAACEARKAAGLWSSVLLRPRPPTLVKRIAKVHSDMEKKQPRNDSTQSWMEVSNLRRAEVWLWCGTTLKEYTNLLNEVQCLNRMSATWGSGNYPIADRTSWAFSTLLLVWSLQKFLEPIGPPRNSKFPSSWYVISSGNSCLLIWASLPAVGITSHLVVLNSSPIWRERSLTNWKAWATASCSPAKMKSSR